MESRLILLALLLGSCAGPLASDIASGATADTCDCADVDARLTALEAAAAPQIWAWEGRGTPTINGCELMGLAEGESVIAVEGLIGDEWSLLPGLNAMRVTTDASGTAGLVLSGFQDDCETFDMLRAWVVAR